MHGYRSNCRNLGPLGTPVAKELDDRLKLIIVVLIM